MITVALLITCIATCLTWVFLLKRELGKKQVAEAALLKSADQLALTISSIELYKLNTPLAYIEWNTEFRAIDWNLSAERIFGYTKEEALNQKAIDLVIVPEDKSRIDTIWQRTISHQGNKASVHKNIDKFGEVILCRWHNTPLYNKDGELLSVVSVATDVTEYEKAKQQLKHFAYHDDLTGLPSLRLGKDRLQQAISSVLRNKLSMAVMYVDLDGFKAINDTYGHDAGDYLLNAVGMRIGAQLRKTDTVARIGGDEFMLVLTDIKDISVLNRVAGKIIDAIKEDVYYNDNTFSVSASIGIAIWDETMTNGEILMKQADVAMYQAKHSGKNKFVFYTSSHT